MYAVSRKIQTSQNLFEKCYSTKTILYLRPKWAKLTPYLRPKLLKNPNLWGCTYLYGPYKGVPPGEEAGTNYSKCMGIIV